MAVLLEFDMKNKTICLGLDIDETLIETERYYGLIDRPNGADFYFSLPPFHYALYKRSFLDQFLQYVDAHFTLFFYTRATKDYAQQIVDFLGYSHVPLFHRQDTLRIEEKELAYGRGNKTIYFKKDLNIIAQRLDTSINNIVFIDDVVSDKEIVPTSNVICVPEFNHKIDDCDLLIIKNHLIESETVCNPLMYINTLQFI